MRSFYLVLAWLAYIALLGLTILCEIISIRFIVNGDVPVSDIVAVMDLAIYFALALAIPVLIRWKLQSANWGTFAVYLFLLAIALLLQGMRQALLGEIELSIIFMMLNLGATYLSSRFLYKHIRHIRAIAEDDRVHKRLR